MVTTQVSRLKKKLDNLSLANKIRENNESAKQSKTTVRVSAMRDMTTVASRSAVHFQKRPEFSQKLLNFSLNFSDTNQNNQSGRFPVLQEEQHE